VMAKQKVQNAVRRAPIEQQPVTRPPCRRLHIGPRLVANPIQHPMRDAASGERRKAAP